ncbi:MAG: terminase small subunit [Oscillospiraceae bacterium]|nr:terminase small subunit [Oscillospiraceae bacterium]
MTQRQIKFAEYYAQSGNVAQAAISAGYSETYARTSAGKILENASVAAYLRSIGADETENRILSATKRQEILSDLAQDGNNAPMERIKAIDTLNKMTGEYTVKVDAAVQPSQKLAAAIAQLAAPGLGPDD